MNKNELIKRFVQNQEEKNMLARVLDKLEAAESKNILENTKFLNEREQDLAERMLPECAQFRYLFHGGYESASRKVLVFFPDYMNPEQAFQGEENCLACIRAEYPADNELSHRDFLGSLLGCGIKREAIGDILVGEGSADIVVLKEILPYLLVNFEMVARVKVHVGEITAAELQVPEAKFRLIKDTVASLRLDNIASAGFAVSREKASAGIKGGKVALNSLECTKADKLVSEGEVISWRGMGKIKLQQIGNQTKKGRTAIVVLRYL
ncbi:RNA-binding S4 domain protein [Syntrophobotulus glycolicus DSM 8271]|uniref:RNA-binding S4 domain protein n=1 Tax=Syntrophobotulus glycolicus (strain DSM 8271 / FlGlyR) TaxID=645991 RepID=F0SYR0_SYNGF|nr:YlmH/Sll1252 family protein [Syntrophobotulus glycolicus]ADY54861.1 RNA-binding S4 domain protein [Syntrophobotulus glycolicus DSM 8271]